MEHSQAMALEEHPVRTMESFATAHQAGSTKVLVVHCSAQRGAQVFVVHNIAQRDAEVLEVHDVVQNVVQISYRLLRLVLAAQKTSVSHKAERLISARSSLDQISATMHAQFCPQSTLAPVCSAGIAQASPNEEMPLVASDAPPSATSMSLHFCVHWRK